MSFNGNLNAEPKVEETVEDDDEMNLLELDD